MTTLALPDIIEDSQNNADSPIDILVEEHRVIRSVLDAMEREVAQQAAGGGFRKEFWDRASDFIRGFADGCHHRKEEDVLFPHLLGHSRSERVFPIVKIKHEHIEGRSLREALCKAAAGNDRARLQEAVTTYARLLREHMDGEERGVFELASALEPETTARILSEFGRVELETLGEGGYQTYLQRARELTAG